ncbi:MAG TPA: alpha/beta hydrolase [Gemmatimonadales bacterium]|nr:alpha/beta hydrolase [Gemmatimonadales bacterium]
MKSLERWIVVAAAASLLAVSCTAGGAADEATDGDAVRKAFSPTLDWSACPDDVETQFVEKHKCGFLTVPQDRSDPQAGRVGMFVVKVFPEDARPSPDPILVFGSDLGRPDGFSGLAPLASRTHRIAYLVEVRGVGHSEPSLECPEVTALEGGETTTSPHSLTGEFVVAVQACRDRLASDGVDVSDFGVQAVAQDAEDLRVALGVPQWNLASYGTTSRYLLEYLREFQSHVRAAFMDSPQFPQIVEVSGVVTGIRSALKSLYAACETDVRCEKAYPDLAASWSEALAQLERTSLQRRITSHDGERTEVTVDAAMFLRVAGFVLGGVHPDAAASLPDMVASAAAGRMTPRLAAIVASGPLLCAGYRPRCEPDESFSLGAYLTVLCHDQAPFVDHAALEAEMAGDPAIAHVFGQHPYLAACEGWNVSPADPAVHEPVLTDVPLLILAGRFDPFSPPSVARAAAESFEQARVIAVTDVHNTLGHNECSLEIRNAWIDEPTSVPTAASCLRDMQIPFHIQEV